MNWIIGDGYWIWEEKRDDRGRDKYREVEKVRWMNVEKWIKVKK